MFEPNSRYAPIETAGWTAPDGRTIPYKRRRFPPPGASLALLAVVKVETGDLGRLDLIVGRALSDPLAFWWICDANDALDPLELVGTAGRLLRIPLPQP
jgi:hypothetical protein